jgi:hypothetical protein
MRLSQNGIARFRNETHNKPPYYTDRRRTCVICGKKKTQKGGKTHMGKRFTCADCLKGQNVR